MRRWCDDAGRASGAVISLGQAWRLADLWYRDRLTAAYRRRDLDETNAAFRSIGLVGPAWTLG